MAPGFSMMGSGIYSQTITREIVCEELCNDCEDKKETCTAFWEQDFETDDWGNVEKMVTCDLCKHSYTFRMESE
jgi:hypothetical protein